MYNFSHNFNSHVLNVYVDMEHQRLIVAYRGRCVMPYPHGGSKVIDVSEFACIHIHSVCPCVCVRLDAHVYTITCLTALI